VIGPPHQPQCVAAARRARSSAAAATGSLPGILVDVLLRVAAPPLSLSFSPTTLAALAASAAHAADAPDKPPEARHNELRNPKVQEV